MKKTTLIADSGGTGTTWIVAGQDELRLIDGPSIQPYFLTADQIKRLCHQIAKKVGSEVHDLYFYGAGLEDPTNKRIISEALASHFSEAHIEVHTDMLGAARALCQRGTGVAVILGTGSNTCFYDGKTIDIRRPGFGFILGDEGSGAVLGHHLLKAWLYGRMPEDLRTAFEASHPMNVTEVLHAVYSSPAPNRFLGSLAPFAAANRAHPFMIKLLDDHFLAFLDEMLDVYAKDGLRQFSCCGSVAWHFQEELRRCAHQRHFEVVSIEKDPVRGLLEYHCPDISHSDLPPAAEVL